MADDRRRSEELTRTDDEPREVARTEREDDSVLARERPTRLYDHEPEPMSMRKTALFIGLALVAGLVSFFVIGQHVSKPDAFAATIAALDEKRKTVMNLVAASTGSSAAISLLPGDAGTPLAEKLVDLSSDFLIVIAAIYLEKYLLTILGFASFKVLIPAACVLASAALMIRERTPTKEILQQLAIKLALFAISAFLVVPVRVRVSAMIENTYEASINETIQTAEQTTDAIEKSAEEGEGKGSDSTNPLGWLLNMPEELSKLTDAAQNSLNNFIEALAVMIVTSCIIPLLVLLFFVWLARIILGIDIDVPIHHRRRHRGMYR